MAILILQSNSEFSEYLTVFTRIDNPVYLSIFIVLLLSITTYFFFKYVLIPLQIEHRSENDRLKKKNLQLLALFAELSQDPLLRLNKKGIIIDANKAAVPLFGSDRINGRYINEILGSKLNFNEDPDTSANQHIYHVHDRSYTVYFKRIPAEDMLLLYMRDITDNLNYEFKLKELMTNSQDQLEEERKRIANELHDSVGQKLTTINLDLHKLQKSINNFVGISDISLIINQQENAINELKRISYNLKPRVLEQMGLGPAIIDLCDSISKSLNFKISTDIKGNERRLAASFETNLYRIIQETINNIIKHAFATECYIFLEYKTDRIQLVVFDDGIGFNFEEVQRINKKSLGLFSIKERVEKMQGKLNIETAAGKGTMVCVEVNCDETRD